MMNIKKFQWREYILSRPDLKKNWNGPMRAGLHYYVVRRIGVMIRYVKNFVYSIIFSNRELGTIEQLPSKVEDQIHDAQTPSIAIFVYIFYPDLTQEIAAYVNRLHVCCDIYLTAPSETIVSEFKSLLHNRQHVIVVEYKKNQGMDIGPFLNQIKEMKKNEKTYDYYLKLHSKRDLVRRTTMFEAVLPRKNYEKIFEMIDQYHIVGSAEYLYPLSHCHQNKNLILQQIQKHNLQVNSYEIYNTIKPFDPEKEKIDVDFYAQYHSDLKKVFCQAEKIDNTKRIENHRRKHGIFEEGRVPNPYLIEKKALKEYKFYAGTIFWFDHKYLDFLLAHLDGFEEIHQRLSREKGALTNINETYTHHLEYWFGLIGSYLNQDKVLRGIQVLNFMIPEPDSNASSGGRRTVLRFIDYLMSQEYIIGIQYFKGNGTPFYWHNFKRSKSIVYDKISCKKDLLIEYTSKYNEIKNIQNINFSLDIEKTHADIHIATGWQTFQTAKSLIKRGKKVYFFCQDLEYLFSDVRRYIFFYWPVKKFYTLKIPTFTMSHYLKNKLNDGRRVESASFDVDTNIYYDSHSSRNGFLLYYNPTKIHRLPQLILKIAENLARQYPEKPIYLYGHEDTIASYIHVKNMKNLGHLSVKEVAQWYNACEVGICFSTTNPSRLGFEMIACGLPCIEADNEFTKFDLPSPPFITVEPTLENILASIDLLLGNPDYYDHIRRECAVFSKNNFIADKEEQAFSRFLNNDFEEK